ASHLHAPLERARLEAQAAELFEQVGDRERAMSLYRDALARDPEPPCAARAAALFWEAGCYADVVLGQKVLAAKPADPATPIAHLVRLGEAARRTGADETAADAYARAVALAPTGGHADAGALRGLGEVLLDLGRFADARTALTRLRTEHGGTLSPS